MKILRPEVEACIKSCGGIHDLFDDMIKSFYNITDDEYDYLAGNASTEELDIFIAALGGLENPSTFSQRKAALIVRNSYVEKYNSEKI
jgi:hypothetical protein